MSSNEKRQHFLDWRAPLRGALISTFTFAADPPGPTFSSLKVSGSKTVVDITAPSIARRTRYNIRCKVVDDGGHIHETEPPIELTVRPGGSF